jgi:cyanophycin synthetase
MGKADLSLEALMKQMAVMATSRSIPVIFPSKNNPVFQVGWGIHTRRFSIDSFNQIQTALIEGRRLDWGNWLDREFPKNAIRMRGRIPTVGITGSVGKTTTAQMVAAILRASDQCVALATTQGAWIGRQQVARGDVAGGLMALNLMRDSRAEFGVFELARGGLIKFGMVIDSINIGAVLNVFDNHLGLNGINTREELARVKRVVAENATDLVVLNADDPLCVAMIPYLKCKEICLVSHLGVSGPFLAHRNLGGLVIFQDQNEQKIILSRGLETLSEMSVAEIPDSFDGNFLPAVINSSFAIAIAHGLGIPFAKTRAALSSFSSTNDTNPGRNNYYQDLPFSLLVTRASGPEAAKALSEFARTIPCTGRRRLLFCCAGDRPNFFIEGIARELSVNFTEYICTDFPTPRGRPAGEVAHILAATLRKCGVLSESIHVFSSPSEAYAFAYDGLGKNDLLVDSSLANHDFVEQIKNEKKFSLCF